MMRPRPGTPASSPRTLPAGNDARADASVSVVIPSYNEARFIRRCIDALMNQTDPPRHYQVIVADGRSTDGTPEILEALQRQYRNLVVIDNPDRIVSTALNRAIAHSDGDVVIRVDGHAAVAPDFVCTNLELLERHPEAWLVGGPIAHRGRTAFAQGVALAMSSRLGMGGSGHRDEHYEGYAEGAAFPAFRRWVFDRVGLFDEKLVRNQDEDFNFRVIRAGGKIYLSPRIKYEYYVRETPCQLWRQYLQYGYWKVPLMLKHGRAIAWRHFVPPTFVLGAPLCLLGVALLPTPLAVVPAAPLLAYVLLLGWRFGATLVTKRSLLVAVSAGIAMPIMHIAYGAGTILGYVLPPVRSPWMRSRMRRISR